LKNLNRELAAYDLLCEDEDESMQMRIEWQMGWIMQIDTLRLDIIGISGRYVSLFVIYWSRCVAYKDFRDARTYAGNNITDIAGSHGSPLTGQSMMLTVDRFWLTLLTDWSDPGSMTTLSKPSWGEENDSDDDYLIWVSSYLTG
jgi:hypothetical protein